MCFGGIEGEVLECQLGVGEASGTADDYEEELSDEFGFVSERKQFVKRTKEPKMASGIISWTLNCLKFIVISLSVPDLPCLIDVSFKIYSKFLMH